MNYSLGKYILQSPKKRNINAESIDAQGKKITVDNRYFLIFNLYNVSDRVVAGQSLAAIYFCLKL